MLLAPCTQCGRSAAFRAAFGLAPYRAHRSVMIRRRDASDAEALSRLERDRVRAEARTRLFGAAKEPVRVARFELRRRLGAGASGVVYAAFDPQLQREVAVKVLALEAGEDDKLLFEARTLARLSHPNVLPVFEAGVHEGAAFIVSELVDGGTLREWLETPRSEAEKLRVLLEVGRGVSAGHARALVHRDIKPENVLVGGDGRARVADFGLAAVHSPNALEAAASGAGPLPGTLRYMAPEQLAGERADPLSDQFSYCVLAFETLTGRLPYEGATGSDLRDAIQRGRMTSVPLDERVAAVLRRGLSASPSARFTTMDALLASLAPPPRRSVLPWVGAALALSLAGGATLYASRSQPAIVASAGASAPYVARAAASTSAQAQDPAAAERAVSYAAQALAQGGRWDECAEYLSTRANTEGLLLLWLGCARVAKDPKAIVRACEAWRARPESKDSPSPLDSECVPSVLRAKELAHAGDYRGCAQAVLGAAPNLTGSMVLADCASKLEDRAIYQAQCRYQLTLSGKGGKDFEQCDRVK